MKEVEVFADIDAPPPVVWDALRSFESYPEWDPICRTIVGVAVEDGARRGRDRSSALGRRPIRPAVVAIEPHRRLAWLDRLVVPFAFDRYHEFRLEPIDDGERSDWSESPSGSRSTDSGRTRLLHRETVRGVLVPLVFDHARVEESFTTMNDAIAARAERSASIAA
ncbi:SRPBCC domain-containing protein [Natrinema gelatinilyticum]|uniref:SRPBCC domain-containing protein n=1 Tax=Natrinema gelatinilyticum TaxID=2961571 RepID=UPI0020C2798F|nr:SRPBCC domain-containing protein [Natrinema gelatinilyticum]